MTYIVRGLDKARFEPLFALDDEALAARRARRLTSCGSGMPCRVSLEEAGAGETVLLLNHISHDVETPFRTSYAIYVREEAETARPCEGEMPPMLDSRTLGLRAFDGAGMLVCAALAEPGKSDAAVRALFQRADVEEIHAHNAAYGCFLARIERS